MKKVIITSLILLMGIVGAYAQSSSDNNTPVVGNHLGWDDNIDTQLRVTQNNTNRMLFNSLPVWNGLFGETANNVNRITLPHSGVINENQLAWSILHLWDNDKINFVS